MGRKRSRCLIIVINLRAHYLYLLAVGQDDEMSTSIWDNNMARRVETRHTRKGATRGGNFSVSLTHNALCIRRI